MTAWGQAVQVYAIIIAAVTPVVALVGVLRTRRWGYAVLLGQLFLLAEVGLIAYAINPDPRPQMSPLLSLAAALPIADLFGHGMGDHRAAKDAAWAYQRCSARPFQYLGAGEPRADHPCG